VNSGGTRNHESRWPAAVALAGAIALYVLLPSPLVIGPRWLLPALEALLMVPLLVTNPDRRARDSAPLRALSILLIAVISAANLSAVGLLVHDLLRNSDIDGAELVYTAIALWLNNVIVFALWYWELDAGGPAVRRDTEPAARDFLFPQNATTDVFRQPWSPGFFDYLYTSFTNSTSFGPTDSMPLTGRAKALMMVQSAASLVTIVLVASRAINLLA